jgi:hypothetical protein
MNQFRKVKATASVLMLSCVLALPFQIFAQTRVEAPSNKYGLSDDVKLGGEAAREVERQLPMLDDSDIQYYVERIGRRLVEGIPSQFQHPEFRYSFKVVNARDINAFALPGGFTYVNRGLIEAAQNEGQLAGVMAHEISHVALRHGTAQAGKGQKYQVGSILGQIAGAVIGGGLGQVIAGASQVVPGVFLLKYSREYERQADTLGAQIMANAGYNPRELANMFRIIEQNSGGGGPEWLSSHPNPGNRYEAINREADMLRVSDPIGNTAQFARVQARLRDMPRARSLEEIGRASQRNPQGGNSGRIGRVAYPSSRYRVYNGGNLFQVSVPDNWREMGGSSEVTFAPEGAYGDYQGRFVFTHGAMLGVTQANSRNLRQATEDFLNQLSQNNQNLRRYGNYQSGSIASRNGLAVTLSNRSEVTGRNEVISIYTTLLRNGDLFYVIGVAPETDYRSYERVFRTMVSSLRLND